MDDKLNKTRFVVAETAHIVLEDTICQNCKEQACLYVCPASIYSLKEGKITLVWQGCVECGACRIACKRGAIKWDYPKGGYGVSLRYG